MRAFPLQRFVIELIVVQKKTGRAPQDRAPHEKRVPQEKSIPRGNVEGKWSHDLHEDSGPVRPRYPPFRCLESSVQIVAIQVSLALALTVAFVAGSSRSKRKKCRTLQ